MSDLDGKPPARPRVAWGKAWAFLALTFLICFCSCYIWLNWRAYFERFPDASWWTFFFQ